MSFTMDQGVTTSFYSDRYAPQGYGHYIENAGSDGCDTTRYLPFGETSRSAAPGRSIAVRMSLFPVSSTSRRGLVPTWSA